MRRQDCSNFLKETLSSMLSSDAKLCTLPSTKFQSKFWWETPAPLPSGEIWDYTIAKNAIASNRFTVMPS